MVAGISSRRRASGWMRPDRKQLEKPGAKVEAVSHHEQRNPQTGSDKHCKLLQN